MATAFLPIMVALICAAGSLASANADDADSNRSVQIIGAPDETRPQLEDLTSQADNTAGLTVEILPRPELRIGSAMTIRVSAKRPGYLVLLDVDADGKLTQLFPNRTTLVAGGSNSSNALAAGKVMTLPEPGAPGFQMVVGPPAGIGMIVAVLSEEPVQLLDLSDVPTQLLGRAEALKYVTDAARALRLEPRGRNGRFIELKLSFTAKLYQVQ